MTDAESAQAQILEAPRALGDVAPSAGAVANVKAISTTPVNTTLGYAFIYHTVEFTGLKPNTRYSYRVGDGTNWNEWSDFTTAAADLQPFSFIYYGDAQNYIDSAVPRVFRQAFADRPQAKMIVDAGDLKDDANNEEQWGQWYKACRLHRQPGQQHLDPRQPRVQRRPVHLLAAAVPLSGQRSRVTPN